LKDNAEVAEMATVVKQGISNRELKAAVRAAVWKPLETGISNRELKGTDAARLQHMRRRLASQIEN